MKEICRRDFLVAGTVGIAGLSLSGCNSIARKVAGRKIPQDASVPERGGLEAHRFFNRIGFGTTPGDHHRYVQTGKDALIEEQLHPTDDDEPALQFQLSRLDVLRVHPAELRDLPEAKVMTQLRQSAILRAVYSRWQLQERMVDFWTNHFNIFALKGDNAYRKGLDDLLVIRKNALGSFPEMIRSSARSSAMLGYLDNQVNKKGVPNENYARELLELHTLGINGGYTQREVQEVARCFTGWTIENRFLRPKDSFRFDPEVHDSESKLVLGSRIPAGGGISDGERVIDIITSHPACAKFIAGKLCRFFLGDAGLVLQEQVAQVFLKSKGNISESLKPILNSHLMLDGPPIVKRPFDFAVSAVRSLNIETDGGPAFQEHLDRMGQPLFGWPMPDGYPDQTTAWTGSILPRWNFAWAMTQNKIEGTTLNLAPVEGRVEDFVLGTSGEGGSTAEHAGVALIDPRFNWR